jgi:two-component system osmolarity sensor histidine kinase EnvZ
LLLFFKKEGRASLPSFQTRWEFSQDMTRFATALEKPARKILPRSLLGRSLLIILVPLLMVQAVALLIFYGSHLNLISRRLSGAVAGEIAQSISLLQSTDDAADRAWILATAQRDFELHMEVRPSAHLPPDRDINILGPMDDDLAIAMRQLVGLPFRMDWENDPTSVLIDVQLPDGVLHVAAPRKRLYTSMIYVYVLWLSGSSILLFSIAALFMRNQVRAIRRLAEAAENFGLGRDTGAIRPEGAVEVRKAATAFNRMQERIRRFLTQRTEMLAGVSHDLRTPLTRLRLALAMLPVDGRLAVEAAEMTADVEEMERMISGYLAFARGEIAEQAQEIEIFTVLEEGAAGARRAGAQVDVEQAEPLTLHLRPDAIRRAVTNLVDNARRHAGHIALSALAVGRTVLVMVDDDGPGIEADRRESVFRPFESGASGGTGLGLTIARDIVRAHGGDITLEQSPMGGLRARVRLPLPV